MKKLLAVILVFAAILMNTRPLQAQGEATVIFLLITPSAANSGMGEGGVALVNDATAVFWNPAGLAFQYENPETDRKGQVSLMHAKWLPQFNFSDLFYDYAAARYSLGELGTVGASITYLNLGKNVWMDENNNYRGTFQSFEYALSLAYATKLQDNLSIGLNAKFIQSKLSDVPVGMENRKGQASAFAVDLGMLWTPDYDILNNRLNLGFNLTNVGPKVTYINADQADPLPTNLRLGLAVKAYDDGFNRLSFIYDLNRMLVYKYTDSDGNPQSDNVLKAVFYSSWVKGDWKKDRVNSFAQSIGLEYKYGDLIALRGGYFYEDPNHGDRQFFTFGGGLGYSIFNFDFSYISAAEDHPLAGTTRFSIGVQF